MELYFCPNSQAVSERGWGTMNFRRGLFRLWIIGSALFVLAVAFVRYTEIKEQFTAVASRSKAELQGSGSDIPNTII